MKTVKMTTTTSGTNLRYHAPEDRTASTTATAMYALQNYRRNLDIFIILIMTFQFITVARDILFARSLSTIARARARVCASRDAEYASINTQLDVNCA